MFCTYTNMTFLSTICHTCNPTLWAIRVPRNIAPCLVKNSHMTWNIQSECLISGKSNDVTLKFVDCINYCWNFFGQTSIFHKINSIMDGPNAQLSSTNKFTASNFRALKCDSHSPQRSADSAVDCIIAEIGIFLSLRSNATVCRRCMRKTQ